MPETYYDVLGVDADASQETIRDAYREKVKEYHPDVSDHSDAEERFKRVKRAETVLADPDERQTYDRLGHDAYVDGEDVPQEEPTEDEVRWAAAQAAAGEHDAGGRSAGWRQRERRQRQRRAEWFTETDDPFDDPFGSSGSDDATGGSSRQRTGRADPAQAAETAGRSNAGPTSATGADGWGSAEATGSNRNVHDLGSQQPTGIPTPNWTQDDVVLLCSSLLLYPILLFLTALPTFPVAARVAIGICAIALVAYLLPRPSFGLPVFGTWSVLIPAFLLGFEISPISAVGIVTLGGVWLPLVYSIAVAMVLAR